MIDRNSHFESEHGSPNRIPPLDGTVDHAPEGIAPQEKNTPPLVQNDGNSGDVGPNGTLRARKERELDEAMKSKKEETGRNGTVNPLGDIASNKTNRSMARKKLGDYLVDGKYMVLDSREGGMGVVYKCHKLSEEQDVALKTVLADRPMSEDEIETMRQSLKLVQKLSRDNIIRVNGLEIDSLSGQCYVEMAWVEGRSLEGHYFRRDGDAYHDWREFIRIFRSVADALDYAHGKGVVHRDVKDSNIMLGMAGEVKLIDFGIAGRSSRPMGGLLQPNRRKGLMDSMFSGTPGFMSPEQWNEAEVTASSDEYSLAVTAYKCLAGMLPFWDPDIEKLKAKVLSMPVPPCLSLPDGANKVLVKAMSIKPENRYTSCTSFIDALEKELSSIEKETGFTKEALYLLATKMDARRVSVEKREWDLGQTFGKHLDAFKERCDVAKVARADRELETSFGFYKQAEAEWTWLERNKPLREEAAKCRDAVKQARSSAESLQAGQFANDAYQKALRNLKDAQVSFENGDFETATAGFAKAKGDFETAAASVRKSCILDLERRASEAMAQHRFEEIPGMIHEMTGLDAVKASELEAAFTTAKADYVSELIAFITEEVKQHQRFTTTYEALRKLEAIEESEGRKWWTVVETAKTQRVQTLVSQVAAAIQAERLGEVENLIQDLASLDAQEADKWKKSLDDARGTLAAQLEENIFDAVEQKHFKEAHNLILRLASIDKAKAGIFETEVRTRELEQNIADAMSQKRFADIADALHDLTVINPEKAGKWSPEVETAKAAYINELEDAIQKLLEQENWEGVRDVIRKLSAVDEAKGTKWEADAHICELEKSLLVALAGKRFEDARSVVPELMTLDAGKAEILKERVETERSSYIRSLVEKIAEHVSHEELDAAHDTARTLVDVDTEEGARQEAGIRIHELELALNIAILDRRFGEAETVAKELSSLDAAKSAEWKANVASAKSECIQKMLASIEEYIGQRRFPAAKKVVDDLKNVDEGEAERQQKTLDDAKNERVRELSTSIMDSIGKGIVDDAVFNELRELETLDEAETKRCEDAIKAIEIRHFQLLEQTVESAIAERRFEDAAKVIDEIADLDKSKAALWREKIKSGKDTYAAELKVTADETIRQHRWDDAQAAIGQLFSVDSATAKGLATTLEIGKLSVEFTESIGKEDFAKADELLNSISDKDDLKAKELTEKLNVAKVAKSDKLEQQFVEMLDQGRLDEARVLLQSLKAFDSGKGQKCEKRLDRATADSIRRLEKDIKRAIKAKQRDNALALVLKLESLSSDKALEWKAKAEAIVVEQNQPTPKTKKHKWQLFSCVAALVIVLCVLGKLGERLYLKQSATNARQSVNVAMDKASRETAELYAQKEYREAQGLMAKATEKFNNGHYKQAKAGFVEAEAAFSTIAEKVRNGHIQQLIGTITDAIDRNQFYLVQKPLDELEKMDSAKATNMKARIDVVKAKYAAEQECQKALGTQVERYANDDYQNASILMEDAGTQYASGNFDKAKSLFEQAKLQFETAASNAKTNHNKELVKIIPDKIRLTQFENAQIYINELKLVDSNQAAVYQTKLEAAKKKKIEMLLEDARTAQNTANWTDTYDKAVAVLRLDKNHLEAQKIKQKSEAELAQLNKIGQLVTIIETSIQNKQFEQTRKDLQKLQLLSSTKANELKHKLEAAEKAHQIEVLLADAKAAQKVAQWQNAYDKAQQVLNLDAKNVEALEIKKICTEEITRSMQIDQLIANIDDFIQRNLFEQGRKELKKLEQLSLAKANDLLTKLTTAEKTYNIEILLADAKKAQDAEDWQVALDKANALLNLDVNNTDANRIKALAIKRMKPVLRVVAVVDNQPVNVLFRELDGVTYWTPFVLENIKAGDRVKEILTYKRDQDDYEGMIDTVVNWQGMKEITVELKKVIPATKQSPVVAYSTMNNEKEMRLLQEKKQLLLSLGRVEEAAIIDKQLKEKTKIHDTTQKSIKQNYSVNDKDMKSRVPIENQVEPNKVLLSLKDAKQRFKEAEENLKKVSKPLYAAEDAVKTASHDVVDAEKSLIVLKQDKAELTRELAKAIKEKQPVIQAKIDTINKKLEKAEVMKEKTVYNLKYKQAIYAKAQFDVVEARKVLEKAKAELKAAELSDPVNKAKYLIADAKDKVAILEKKLDIADDNVSNAKRELAKVQDVAADAEKKIKTVEQDIFSLHEKVVKATPEKANILKAKIAENQRLRIQILTTKVEIEKVVKDATDKLAMAISNRQDITKELESAKADVADAEKNLKRVKSQFRKWP